MATLLGDSNLDDSSSSDNQLEKGYVETGCLTVIKTDLNTTTPTFCPYKYNNLANAPNPCNVQSCDDNSQSDSCRKQAVYTYCSISEKMYNDVEMV